MAEASSIDHIIASEEHRYETLSRLLKIPSITRHQLALAGFIYRDNECVCPQCGIKINLINLDINNNYPSNYFRKLHREKISYLGKRCAFLLCQSGTNIDNLHPSLPSHGQEKLQWDDAEQPEFSDYITRLQTFDTWPYSQGKENTFVTASNMAEHGFYFSGPNDSVTCFYCGNILTNWSDIIHSRNEYIVQLEHARFFPCRFITYIVGRKFVANADYLHPVTDQERRLRNPVTLQSLINTNIPQSIDECLLTFEDWPEDAPILAKDLAETGFYYLGDKFRVKCFMCNLEVEEWYYGMTALGTHSRRRNNCEIVQAILSTKTSDIQSVNEKWRLQTLTGLTFGSDSDENLCRELAACGFYRFKNTKNIRCAYCGVLIDPKLDSSIMSQHRLLAKQSKTSSILDCLMVRAQCPVNILIPNRERFPEYREFQSIFTRIDSFSCYKERYKVSEKFLRERAEAGFFLDTMKRMRCFQCGNSLPINDRKLYERYSQTDIAKLHAHFYPTCEWVQEILGLKYVGQVLFDRNKLNDIEHQQSYNRQFSSASSRTTSDSFSSVSTTPSNLDVISPIELISDYSAESDEEGYETIATPLKSRFTDSIFPMQSPPPSSSSLSGPLATPPTDNNPSETHNESTSPMIMNKINPFERAALESKSPPLDIGYPTATSPVDPHVLFAYEINRLESFKKRNRETFAQIKVEELAYVGFYLTAESTAVQCPWCKIEITEERFQYILQQRPIIPGSPLNDVPWTAMRVHRHVIGQVTSKDHTWCPWVRREPDGLYPNIMMNESRMQYPEYPTYSTIEKRIKSFESDWIYPSGTRLSNLMMADAGFIYLGEGKVCCYYCGNRLYGFDPLDCPFEEHAVYHPLCDYIIQKRGLSYVERILKESMRTSSAKQKWEMNGTQKIKSIFFSRPGISINKRKRQPVLRLNSRLSTKTNRSLTQSTTNTLEIIENDCQLCYEKIARYEYEPCQHCPMCGECSVKLTSEQHEECIICRRRAKIAEIHLRVPQNTL